MDNKRNEYIRNREIDYHTCLKTLQKLVVTAQKSNVLYNVLRRSPTVTTDGQEPPFLGVSGSAFGMLHKDFI